jgi:hypothetical protein
MAQSWPFPIEIEATQDVREPSRDADLWHPGPLGMEVVADATAVAYA